MLRPQALPRDLNGPRTIASRNHRAPLQHKVDRTFALQWRDTRCTEIRTITSSMMGSLSSPSRLSASLRPRLRRGFGLDGILDRARSRLLRDGPGAYGPQGVRRPTAFDGRVWTTSSIAKPTPKKRTFDRCRELLGDEAAELSDEQVDTIRRHAHAMAHVLVEMFRSPNRTPEPHEAGIANHVRLAHADRRR